MTKTTMPAARPQFTGDQLREAFRRYDRDPFHDMAARLYEDFFAIPDKDRQAWARKYPDRLISSMATIARLAGFTEKQEVLHTHTLDMTKMSDVQLADLIRAKMNALALDDQGVVDAEVVEVPNAPEA